MSEDVIDQFRREMECAGLVPPDQIKADGKLHRCGTEGKPKGQDGSYLLHLDDAPAGGIQNWTDGQGWVKWKADLGREWTPAENEQYRRQIESDRRKREAETKKRRAAARERAAEIWSKAKPADTHPYLADKGVKPHGIRQHWKALVVPVMDAGGRLMSLQSIAPDGKKKFLPGGAIKGGFHHIGEPGSSILVAEGYATAATLHEATGLSVAAAFNCNNLLPVAEAIRAKYPDAEIILAGDDDANTEGNPGRTHAETAARVVGGKVAFPDFGSKRPAGVSDFNDLAAHRGPDAVRQQVEAACDPGWPDPEPLITAELPEIYPVEALPEMLRAAVVEVQTFTQAPMPLVAGSALAVLSLAGQALADVQRAAGLAGPCSLFVLAVAESGERKTTADGLFLDPVRQWERTKADEAEPAVREYRGKLDAWEAVKDGLKTRLRQLSKAGKRTGEAASELQDYETLRPTPPRVPRLLRVDATPEALGYALAHEWPSAGLITSEGGVLFGSHGMGKDSVVRNLGLLNTLWDGKPHPVERRTSASYTVRGARLTVGVQVQAAPLREFTEKFPGLARGMGFFARFLIARPESTQGTRLYREPPASWPALSKLQCRLSEMLDTPQAIEPDGTLSLPILALSAPAKAAWIEFHDDVEHELRPVGELAEVRDIASKAADNVARLACLFHLLEQGPVGEVQSHHITAAAGIVAWHLCEARRFFADLVLPPELANAETLDAWLIARCRESGSDSISTREVQQFGPNATRRGGAKDEALAILEAADRVTLEKEGRQKRVRINPALLQS